MTKEEWGIVEKKLAGIYCSATLMCDGYRLTLCLEPISKMGLAICAYINGTMDFKYALDECEERKRFFCVRTKAAYTQKERKDLIKSCGKRWLKNRGFELDKVYTSYYPWWKSFRSLKAHLIKNNTSIELAPEAP